MAPVTPYVVGPSAATEGAIVANVAGTPTFLVNTYFNIASSNDVLMLSPNGGTTLTVDITDGLYSPTELCASLVTIYAAATTSAGAITAAYNTSTYKYSITAGTGETIKYLNSGSDGGATWGFTADSSAALTITSDSAVEAANNITFTFAENDNADTCDYAINEVTTNKWVNATTGVITSASTLWNLYSGWDGNHEGTVTVTGLTAYTGYRFKVLTRDEADVQTAFSGTSATMYSHINIDYGDVSAEVSREVTSGQTKIKLGGLDGSSATLATSGTHGAISCTFALQNNYNISGSVQMQYSEDGSTYSNAKDFFDVDSTRATLRVNTDSAGATQSLIITQGEYASGGLLAEEISTKILTNSTLTATQTNLVTVVYSNTTGKYTFDALAGHTINIEYYDYSDAAYMIGFTDNAAASQIIVSDESRGQCPRGQTTLAAGREHEIYWDSYFDAGKSEYDTSVYLRMIPYDEPSLAGSAGATETSQAFTIDNRPSAATLTTYDTFTFDEDTTPAFVFTMRDVYGGSVLYPKLIVYDYNDSVEFTKELSTNPTGWMYQQDGATYTACVLTGIPAEFIDGTNKVRYTPPSADALDIANKKPYKATIHQGELRDRS